MTTQQELRIGIPELLMALRRDLEQAQANLKRAKKAPLLEVEASEIEVLVTLSRSSEGGGGLNINVLGIGIGANAKAVKGAQFAHRIKLSLKPAQGKRIGGAGASIGS